MSRLLRTSIFRTTTTTTTTLPWFLPRAGLEVGARAMSDHSTRHGNDPEVIEKNKQSLLRKHAKGSTENPHWHEELASDAEAFVKAQRGEIEASEMEIAKLEEITKKQLHPKMTDKKG